MARPLIQRILTRFDGSGINRARKAIRNYARDTGRTVNRSQADVEASSGRVARTIRRAYQAVFVFITTQVVGALGQVTQKLFETATAAEETASQFDTVFGPAAGRVNDFLDEFIQKTNLTVQEAQRFAAQFGGLFSGIGADAEQVGELSEQMVTLAGDLASFNNVPIQQALEALRSGIIGETEPLRQLNITFRQLDANAAALAQTGKTSADNLTELERAMGRVAVITERAGVQVGDLDRTLDDTQNQARILQGEVRRMNEAFSRNLLPTFNELITFGEQILDNYQDAGEELGERFAGSVGRATTEVLHFVDASRLLVGTAQDAISALKQTEQGGLNLLQPLRWLREEIEGIEEGVGRSVEVLLQFRTAWEEAVRPGSQRAIDARDELEDFREAREERQRSIEQAQQARDEARRLFNLETELNNLVTDISQGNVDLTDAMLDDMLERFQEAAEIEGEIGQIYEDLVGRIELIQQARDRAAGGGDPDSPDGGDPSDRAIQQADEALRKIQRAQQLAATFTDEQREALQEVFDAEEEIAELKQIEVDLGEEAVAAELETAEARRDRAREALEEAEAFRREIAEAAHILNDMPLGQLGAEPGLDTSGRTFTVGEGEEERTFFGDAALRGLGFDEEEIARLERAVARYNAEAEEGRDTTSELGESLQDIGRAVRSVTRLVDVFGDLSDEARTALNGVADMIDGIGRLDTLIDDTEGVSNLGELFQQDFGSAIVPTISAISGVASVVASALQGNNEELRRHLDQLRENVRALDRNTEAIFEQAQIAADVSEAELDRGRSIEERLTSDLGMSSAERQNLFADLAEIPGLRGIDEVAQDLWDTLSESIIFRTLDREQQREVINSLLFGGADPEAIGEQFGVDLSDVIDDSFEPVGDRLDRIGEQLGEFGESVDGAIQFLGIFRQLGLSATEEMGAFIDFLLENVEGLPPAIQGALDELAELDLSTEEGRRQARAIIEEWVQQILGEEFDFGDLSPEEVNRLIGAFFGFVDDAEGGGDGQDDVERRTAQVARTITEFQANELLAYQREQVLLLREIVNAVGGQAALENVGASTTGTSGFPTATFDTIAENTSHLAEIRATLDQIAQSLPRDRAPALPSGGGNGGGPNRGGGKHPGGPTYNIEIYAPTSDGEGIARSLENRVLRTPLR